MAQHGTKWYMTVSFSILAIEILYVLWYMYIYIVMEIILPVIECTVTYFTDSLYLQQFLLVHQGLFVALPSFVNDWVGNH